MDEIVKDFLIESGENLDRLDQELVRLETDPKSKELLASIFRTIHTIKGSCGFLAFARLEKVAHAGENLLSRLRDGELVLTAEVTSGLLAMVDAVRHMLSDIQATEHDGENDYTELREELKRLLGGAPPPAPESTPPAGDAQLGQPASSGDGAATLQPPPQASAAEAYAPATLTSAKSSAISGDAPVPYGPTAGRLGGLLVERGSLRHEDLAKALHEQEHGDRRRLGEILVALKLCKQEDISAVLQQIHGARGGEGAAVETVRIGVPLLDELMNLIGELVLARNQLLQLARGTKDKGFHAISQRINLVAAKLQGEVLKTRMQPISTVWNKFPRTVRDLALSCHKEVRLEMEGQDTEVDRTIIEAIRDPLTHLVRNAIDHGIETPEMRRTAGKEAAGVLKLRAFHESGQVNIEISDDGAGLNGERIRQKAVERGLISPQQAARMTDRDVFNLIFLPGFSTAEQVTKVSGRGVGMDVVRTNVEKIGGTVDIQSTPGAGATVRLGIPLTLAIIPALMVRSGGERFAIPQMSLTELVRLGGNKGIEMLRGAAVCRLRGRLLPLVYLRQALDPSVETEEAGDPAHCAAELADFAAARKIHHQWPSRLRDVLDGKVEISPDEAGSARECALGSWLYGSCMKEYAAIPETGTLEQIHTQFHNLAREVLSARARGDTKQAEKTLQSVTRLSNQILDLLTTVETKVLELQNVKIVVLQTEGRQFGLVVDDILDTQEIVVKPLGKRFKGINVFAGATILGDGVVALILDVKGLAERASIRVEAGDSAIEATPPDAAGDRRDLDERQTLILVENGPDARVAIPLNAVSRLEEFPESVIQRSGQLEVMHYRGQIIPLLRLSSILPGFAAAGGPSASIPMVICSVNGRTAGLIVDRIVDIVEHSTAVESVTVRPGIAGTSMIEKRITDVLDVPAIVQSAVPGYLEGVAGS